MVVGSFIDTLPFSFFLISQIQPTKSNRYETYYLLTRKRYLYNTEIMKKFLIFLTLILLFVSCVTQKNHYSQKMYNKRATFIRSHGEPYNVMFDRRTPNVFR